MRFVILILAAGTLGLGIYLRVAPPQDAPSQHMGPWMERLDSDGDMQISRVEYVQVSDGLIPFDMVDFSGDGAIDMRELERFMRHVDPMWTFAEPD